MVSKRPLCFVLLYLISACSEPDPAREGHNGIDLHSTNPIPVETQRVERGQVVDKVEATGTIFPLHDVLVSSETSGTVRRVLVEVGDRVQAGALLVQVDAELKQLAVQQAKAAVRKAKATFEKASRDFDRNRKLYDNKDISKHVFETARLNKESSFAALLSAEANLKIAERRLRDAGIRSPVDGLVAARMVELGSMVAPGSPVAKVVDISRVKVKFGVPEREIVKLYKEQPARVTVVSYRGLDFSGTVSSVGPQADLATRTFPVEVLVDNPGGKLKAGMVANVAVAARTLQDVPLLPKSALLERAGQMIIFVVRDGRAERRLPRLGLETGDKVAVTEGVQVGESVVVLGQENLSDGVEVSVR